MRWLLLVVILILPISAHAKVSSEKWNQGYVSTLSNGEVDLLWKDYSINQVMPLKVDPNNKQSLNHIVSVLRTATGKTISDETIDNRISLYYPSQSQKNELLPTSGILLTPQMYGAKADGVTDDTASIQSAVSAICSFSHVGGEIYFPPGRYLINNVTIPCQGVYIKGAGAGNRDTPTGTELYNNSTSSIPMLYFKATTENYAYGGGVSDIGFFNAGINESTGPQIEVDYAQQFYIQRIYSFHAFSVVKLVGGRSNRISDLYAEDILPGGIGIELLGTGASADSLGQLKRMDTPVLNNISLNAGAPTGKTGTRHMTGIYAHGFVQTIQMHNIEITNPYYGLLVDCTVANGHTIQAASISACPGFFDLDDVEIDFADISAFKFSDFSFFKMRDTYAHGGNGTTNYNNLQAYAPNFNSFGLEILGGKFDQAQGSCIYSAANNTRVIGADIHHCNIGKHARNETGSAGVEFGIDIKTRKKFDGIISNNSMCISGPDASSTMDGIYIAPSLSYVAVNGNIFLDCRSGYNYSGISKKMANFSNIGP